MRSYTSRMMLITILVVSIIISDVGGQRGQSCRLSRRGPSGRCKILSRCPAAIEQIRQNLRPQICGFQGREPIVCCPRRSENIFTEPSENLNTFPPTPTLPGEKAKKKCEEYANLNVEQRLQLHTAVVGGKRASAKEYPHMAALGFGEESDIQWLCGGTLISEEFVLTAAHCLYSQEQGDVKFVRLGDLNLKSVTDDSQPQNFRVAATYSNPGYDPPQQYNDIALVKLDHPAELTNYVKPACLQTTFELPDVQPTATGWGRVGYTDDTSDDLMKVSVSYFTTEQCRQSYSNIPQRRLPKGIDGDLQICAGGINESKDTCQGDSGGPLQIRSPDNSKLFYVVGVTSFGKGCGIANTPGVYTRVSSYIFWIEETVWPSL